MRKRTDTRQSRTRGTGSRALKHKTPKQATAAAPDGGVENARKAMVHRHGGFRTRPEWNRRSTNESESLRFTIRRRVPEENPITLRNADLYCPFVTFACTPFMI
jgi:hypothetical protein